MMTKKADQVNNDTLTKAPEPETPVAEETKPVPVTEEEAEADHTEGQTTTSEPEIPAVEPTEGRDNPLEPEARKVLEDEYPMLKGHGTHDAAVKGLQTDASGSYDRSKL